MRKLCIATMALGLAGCAPDIWDKGSASEADFRRDAAICEMYAEGVPVILPQRVPSTYTSTTTYNGMYTGTANGGLVSGTAQTTYQEQPNTGQAIANLGAAIGTAIRQKQANRACMTGQGYALRDK